MALEVERFFDLFLEELRINTSFSSYYKYHEDSKSFAFRKAYFIQRLQYIRDVLKDADKNETILDIGCGYATTALYLVLNGYKVHGTTLEFYYKHIPERLAYWKQFGEVSGLTVSYENLFDTPPPAAAYSNVIIQDTLHHLEPLQEALSLVYRTLKPGGRIIAIEENGSNVIQRLKLYKQRGNKRIITIHDETLKKDILLGNENIRSLSVWTEEMKRQRLEVDPSSVQYIRYYFPRHFSRRPLAEVVEREQSIWRKNAFLREYFFFGVNFLAVKR